MCKSGKMSSLEQNLEQQEDEPKSFFLKNFLHITYIFQYYIVTNNLKERVMGRRNWGESV